MTNECSALDIANYLIYLMSSSCDDLSNMKLNKLLYYAQGHCLQKTGVVMFSDPIEAWEHGPIVTSVYHKYKSYGDSHISEFNTDDLNKLPDEYKDILLDVARTYGRYTAAALRNMTHVPKSPWSQVYKPNVQHVVISVPLITDYFNKNVEELHSAELNLSEDDFVGYRDSDGILVLPKEWDDEEV